MPSNLVYTIGRLCAVATRPLCLFIANNYLSSQAAQDLALGFLAAALAMMAIAADPHRYFYSRQFAARKIQSGFSFYVYVFSVLLLGGVGSAAVFGVTLHFSGSTTLAIMSVLYFISEKLGDEVLRFRLFETNFLAWGRTTIARSALQIGGVVIVFLTVGRSTPGWLTMAVLGAGNLMVFLPATPSSLRRVRLFRQKPIAFRLFRRAAAALLKNWRLWATAVLGSGIVYVDRLVALLVDATTLPLFMLVVMAFSLVQMAVDFYYVSTHRREFLLGEVSVRTALLSRGFLGSFTAGLIVAVALCAAILQFSRNGDSFPLWYIFVIAVLQCSAAATTIPQQIIYWSQHLVWILRVECAFWLLFGLGAAIAWRPEGDSDGPFAVVAFCAMLRLALYVVLAMRVPPRAGIVPLVANRSHGRSERRLFRRF